MDASEWIAVTILAVTALFLVVAWAHDHWWWVSRYGRHHGVYDWTLGYPNAYTIDQLVALHWPRYTLSTDPDAPWLIPRD